MKLSACLTWHDYRPTHWIGAAWIALSLLACEANAPASEKPAPESPSRFESLEEKTLREYREDSLCRTVPLRICNFGVGAAALGEPIRNAQPLPGTPLPSADSLDNRGGFVWVTRSFHFARGRILVEGEFFDVKAADDTLLSGSMVNRIRIESPEFFTAEGLRVGDAFARLNELFGADRLLIVPVPGYQALDVTLRGGVSRLHFMLNDPGYQLAGAAIDGLVPPSVVPPQAQIQYLVVM